MGKTVLALFTAGILGFFLPDILGGGNELVNKLAVAPMSVSLLFLLLVAKFLFTMLSYGSGVPGGIFLPLLVVGALTGAICGDSYIQFGLLDAAYRTNIIILAMAAYFSAVVKSPVTGSILIMEMTGSFNHMLPLIIVSITAYLVADLAKTGPIYEDLLARSLNRQGRFIASTPAEKRQVIELPVCMGSKLDGKFIRDIKWPPDCLLVSIRRGEQDLVPKGDARMMVGDYLFVLTPSEHSENLRRLAE